MARKKTLLDGVTHVVESDDMEIFYRGTSYEKACEVYQQAKRYEAHEDKDFDQALSDIKARVIKADADGFVQIDEKDTPWYQEM